MLTIDYDLVNKLFCYCPETGILSRKEQRGGQKKGSEVGTRHKTGQKRGTIKWYLRCAINGDCVYVHRVIYVLMTGEQPEQIDHIDGNGLNNRWENLRSVSQRINSKNQKTHKTNTSGSTGVCFRKDSGKWRARIMVDGKMVSLGSFCSKESAILARADAEKQFGFTGG